LKKVLIITYYWPPAGGPGVQRIVKFVKEMPNLGWQPLILTVKDPSSPATDENLLTQIPKNIRVYKTATLEPFALYKYFTGKDKNKALAKDTIIQHPDEKLSERISRIVRANLFLPDARVGWIPSMVKQGLLIIKAEKPDIIFSTSPPHSLQIGAKRLAYRSGLKWIADFRDPWLEAYWEKDIKRIGFSSRINKNLEMSVLKSADLITTVSDGICDHLRNKTDNKIETIYSGFDIINEDQIKSNLFEIIYLGNMSKLQSPEPVFKAINLLSEDTKSLIKIIFVGNVFSGFGDLLKSFPDISVESKDYQPRDKMMNIGKSGSLLLLINPPATYAKAVITAKIFDYLSLRKPILAIGEKDGSLEKLLEKTISGSLFRKDDIPNISLFIKKYIDIWRENSLILFDDNHSLDPYRTKNNVKKLTKLFDQFTKRPAVVES
jgi:glycosyltransferase involved in cell wall biosynthesis